MITAAKVIIGGESIDYVVGKADVNKIFFDRDSENVLVVLLKDNIVEYHNCVVVVQKDYKEVK